MHPKRHAARLLRRLSCLACHTRVHPPCPGVVCHPLRSSPFPKAGPLYKGSRKLGGRPSARSPPGACRAPAAGTMEEASSSGRAPTEPGASAGGGSSFSGVTATRGAAATPSPCNPSRLPLDQLGLACGVMSQVVVLLAQGGKAQGTSRWVCLWVGGQTPWVLRNFCLEREPVGTHFSPGMKGHSRVPHFALRPPAGSDCSPCWC